MSDANYASFKVLFLEACSVPVDNVTGLPQFTEDDWVQKEAASKLFYLRQALKGKRIIFERNNPQVVDPSIIS
jgi:hypothetical protein